MKIALVAPDDFSIWHFRKGLIKFLLERNYKVYAISGIYRINESQNYRKLIKQLGAIHIPVKINRFLSPVSDLKLLVELYNIFKREGFDIVHNFTVKPNTYGSIAAKLAGTRKIISSVTGLGFVKSHNMKSMILNLLIKRLYWICFKLSDKIWFQNPDDMNYFLSLKILDRKKGVLIKGSGVNIKEFSMQSLNKTDLAKLKKELNITQTEKVITMVVARVIWSKGVREFIEAGKILKEKYPLKFILVGPLEEESPQSVSKRYLLENEKVSNIKWINFIEDVKKIYAISDVVVLPSYYGEGIPRSLLEAMAMEKPIITTDNVGCREVVEDGKNGYLVPIKDSKALANAIEKLIIDENKRKEFGRYSRIKVEKEFDEKIVIERIINELYQLDY